MARQALRRESLADCLASTNHIARFMKERGKWSRGGWRTLQPWLAPEVLLLSSHRRAKGKNEIKETLHQILFEFLYVMLFGFLGLLSNVARVRVVCLLCCKHNFNLRHQAFVIIKFTL